MIKEEENDYVKNEPLYDNYPQNNAHNNEIYKSCFGLEKFDCIEKNRIKKALQQRLEKQHLKTRPGPGGCRLTYIESSKVIQLANEVFGFNGWSCSVLQCKEEYKIQENGRWNVAYSAVVRVKLKDGCFHEDFGFGQSLGQRDLGSAIEQARKSSISDARKRALRLFGEYLGNSLYDAEYIREMHSKKVVQQPIKTDTKEQTVKQASNQLPTISNKNNTPQPNVKQEPDVYRFQRKDRHDPVMYSETSTGKANTITTVCSSSHKVIKDVQAAIHNPSAFNTEESLDDISFSQFDYDPNDNQRQKIRRIL